MRCALSLGGAFAASLTSAAPASAGPLPKPPPASTEPSLPTGVTLDPVVVPSGPAFAPRPAKWWKKKKPCPAGAKLEKIVEAKPVPPGWRRAFVCRDADGKQHGPGVAVFDNDKPYEDSWSEHGKHHGTRFTWRPDGKMDHIETFVDDLLHGPATEWSGGEILRTGQYKDDQRYGFWTESYPTKLVLRGYLQDGGDAIGTWIGTRAGVATAIVVEEHESGPNSTVRLWSSAGELTFERRKDATGGTATAYLSGVRIADYDCGLDSAIGESRFYDDEGLLQRRWNDRTGTLTDRAGTTLVVTDEQKQQLHGVRDACNAASWMLEGPPPSRHAAFGKPPPPFTPP
jgi:hypothetical protein